jgi:anti-sigma B factor antagonist
MELKAYQENEVTVIEIIGHLDTMTSPEYEKQMTGLIDSGIKQFVADCSQLDYISSSGLRVLLMTLKKISNAGGKFILCGMQTPVLEVFKICRFDNLFTIVTDKQAALKQIEN